MQCRCHPTCSRFKWRTHKPLDWWIPIAPSGSRQLGRPKCNLAAERDRWGGSDAGRQATSRVIWGSKRDWRPLPLDTANACTFHKLRRGPFVSICLRTAVSVYLRGGNQRSQARESVSEVWFETGVPEAAPLSACPSIPTAQSRWSCRGRVLR